MYGKRPVAVVPDACTLIYASMDENTRSGAHPVSVKNARELLALVKSYADVCVISENLVETAAKTDAVLAMTDAEKKNFTSLVNGMKHVYFPRSEIVKQYPVIDRIYEKARNNFEEKVDDLLATKEKLRVSKKRGVPSKRKMKRWAAAVKRKLGSTVYEKLRYKLYDEPPGEDDKYLLSFGYLLRDEYDQVFVATEDTHMCPLLPGCDMSNIIYGEIEWRLGIRTLQPFIVKKEVARILGRVGAPEGHARLNP
ncbi:MAG: hypothetical protein QXD77_00330 [Candidatus Aenigmatarchaeota archaeon]